MDNLRTGHFPLVILNQGTRQDVDHLGNFTRTFVSALDYGYAVTKSDVRYQVYTPAPLQHLVNGANFDGKFDIVGWSLTPDELRAGTDLDLTVLWHALQTPTTRYTTFAHLEDANGKVVAQDDHEPIGGTYPTPLWRQDEMVRDTYHLRVPPDLPSGDYFLRVGWYDTTTQDRLSLMGGADFYELEKLVAR